MPPPALLTGFVIDSHFHSDQWALSASTIRVFDAGVVAATRRSQKGYIEMDEIDLQIISLLQQDAQITNADLARLFLKPPVSAEVVRRRRQQLVREGHLRITGVPDARKIGYKVQVMIGLRAELGRINEVADALCEIDEVGFVWVTAGSFDIFAWAATKSLDDLNLLVRSRMGRIDGVKETRTFVILETKKQEHGFGRILPSEVAEIGVTLQ